MGVGQLQPKRDPDIARSDCPVPHLGQRRRVPPVNVPSDSVRDFRSPVVLHRQASPKIRPFGVAIVVFSIRHALD